MRRRLRHAATILATILPWASEASATALCLPRVEITSPRAAPGEWTATITADASRCRTSAGPVQLSFVRLKENAPDETFMETGAWNRTPTQHSVRLTVDEAIADYWVRWVPACPCRTDRPGPAELPAPTDASRNLVTALGSGER
jgi:hypothetical protein